MALAMLPLFAPVPALGHLAHLHLRQPGLPQGLADGRQRLRADRHHPGAGVLLLPACADDPGHRARRSPTGASTRRPRRMGTPRWRVFWTVTLPGVSYGLICAAFVVFTLVVTDFGIAKVIGGQFNVLATDAYKQVIGQQNFEMGAVVGFVLLVPAVIAFVARPADAKEAGGAAVGARRAARAARQPAQGRRLHRLLPAGRRADRRGRWAWPCGPRSSPTGPTTSPSR